MRIAKAGNIGIGTTSPATTALLDLTSTTQGFLTPRMTQAQRNAISSPATGLVIYNTDTNLLNIYNGTAWSVAGNDGTTAFSFPAGSAGSPGLYVTGDSDTGLYQATANTVSFTAGASEVARFDNNGIGSTGADYFKFTPSATGSPGTITMSAAGSDTDINIAIAPKGEGGVGIGTTAVLTPSAMQLSSSVFTNSLVSAEKPAVSGHAEMFQTWKVSDEPSFLYLSNSSATNSAFAGALGFRNIGSSTTANLTLSSEMLAANDSGTTPAIVISGFTRDNAQSFAALSSRPVLAIKNNSTTILTATANNNIAIGTNAATHALEVAGTINASGNITGANISGTNTGDQTITLSGDVSGSGTGPITTTIGASKVTNAMLAGSITLTKLNTTGTQDATTFLRGDSTWQPLSSIVTNSFGAGTVTSPGFYVTGDSNTGFYQATADTLSITAGASEVARFDNSAAVTGVDYFKFTPSAAGSPGTITMSAAGSDTDVNIAINPKGAGKVGIGVTTPQAKLDIQAGDSANGIYIRRAGSVITHYLSTDTSGNGYLVIRDAAGTSQVSFNSSGVSYLNGGNIGIGTTAPGSVLHVYAPSTSGTDFSGMTINGAQSVANTGGYRALVVSPSYSAASGNTLNVMYGILSNPYNSSTGTVSSMYSVGAWPQNSSSGAVTTMQGLFAQPTNSSTGTVMNMYGLWARCDNINAGGTVTNCYELYLATPNNSGTMTNKYGVYQQDSATKNFFAGSVGIGASPVSTVAAGAKATIRTDSTDTGSSLFIEDGQTSGGAATHQGLYVYGRAASRTADLVRFSALTTSGYNLLTLASGEASDGTGATTRMVVTAAGDVGIGTTSPATPLDVHSSTNNQQVHVGTNNQRLELGYDTTSNYGRIQAVYVGTGTEPLVLQPAGGNVGIGTTSPGYTLDVTGTIHASGAVTFDSGVTYGGAISATAFIPTGSTVPTNGVYLPATNTLGFATNTGEAMRINATNQVGINTTTMTGQVNIYAPSTATAADSYGLYVNGAQSTANTSTNYGAYINNTYTAASGNTLASLIGASIIPQNTSTGAVTSMYGANIRPQNTSSGTVGTMYGIVAQPIKSGTGAVTTMIALYGRCQNSNATGVVTTCYGLYLSTPDTTGAITNKYGVYQQDANSNNYFAGNVGFGTTSPDVPVAAYLDSADVIHFGRSTTQFIGSMGSSVGNFITSYSPTNNAKPLIFNATTDASDTVPSVGTNRMYFRIRGANAMIISDSGNVGIGTSSPGYNLDVSGTANVSGALTVGSFVNTGSDTATAFIPTGSTVPANGMYLPTTNTLGFATNSSEAMRINASNQVGINTTTMTGQVSIYAPSTQTAANSYGLYVNGAQSTANTGAYAGIFANLTYTATSGNTLAYMDGVMGQPQNSSTGTISYLRGVTGWPRNMSTGTVTDMYGLYAVPENAAGGTVGSMYGVRGQPIKSGTGAVTNMYGLWSQCQNTNATGTVTNCYGLYLAAPTTTGAITNKYGVYQADSASNNIFMGGVGIGSTAVATQALDVNGNIALTNATSNTIFYGHPGVAAPGAGSAGEKIQLYGTAGTVGASDYAIGIESGNMWFNTGGGMKWYANGAAKMVMDSSGNVGIGTTSPGAALDIRAGSSMGQIIHVASITPWLHQYFNDTYGSSTVAANDYIDNSGNYFFGTPGATNITFYTNGTGNKRMTIDSSGKVAIGTTSPKTTLDVTGVGAAPSLSADTGILNITPDAGAVLAFGAQPTSPFASWIQAKRRANDGISWPLLLNPLGGKVAIGTTAATHDLEVSGTANISGALTAGSFSPATLTTPTVIGGSAASSTLTLESTSGTGTSDAIIFKTGSQAEAMRIDTGGRVGIGTASPASSVLVDIYETQTNTSGSQYTLYNSATVSPATDSTGVFYGAYNSLTSSGSSAIANMNGARNYASHAGTGLLTTAYGGYNLAINNAGGDIGTAYGAFNDVQNTNNGGIITSAYGAYNRVYSSSATSANISAATAAQNLVYNAGTGSFTTAFGSYDYLLNSTTGTIGTGYGVYVRTANSGTLTNWFGVYIAPVTGTAPANSRYPLYVADTGDSYFAGSIGIGTASPSSRLQVSSAAAASVGYARFVTSDYVDASVGSGLLFGAGANSGNTYSFMNALSAGFSAANNLVLQRNSGNVGIGSTAPAYELDVVGNIRASSDIISTGSNAFRMVNGNYGAFWRNDGSNTYLLMTASGDQYGSWNTLRPFYVNDSTGRVAMANGVDMTGGDLKFANGTANVVYYGNVGVAAPGASSVGEKIQLYGTAGTVAASDYAIGIESSAMWFNTDGAMKWYVSGVAKMAMDGTGKLGIGTTTPGYTLDVNGTANISGALTVGSFVNSGSETATAFIPSGATVPTNGMYLGAANTLDFATNSAKKLELASAGGLTAYGTNGGFFAVDRSTSGTGGLYRTGGINRLWDSSAGDVIAYDTSGNVGIGSSSPGYKLDVAGDINATSSYKLSGNSVLAFPDGGVDTSSIAVGKGALDSQTSSSLSNTAVGLNALTANITGSTNTAVGEQAMQANQTGNQNVAVGGKAANAITGSNNTAVGYGAMVLQTNGSNNTALGIVALEYTDTGSGNTAIGGYAMQSAVISHLTSGSNNTAVGYKALNHLQGAASTNTGLGYNVGATLTTGSSNILIGNGADVPSASTSNYINIGNTIYGNTSTGNVGIGITPSYKLHVLGTSGTSAGYFVSGEGNDTVFMGTNAQALAAIDNVANGTGLLARANAANGIGLFADTQSSSGTAAYVKNETNGYNCVLGTPSYSISCFGPTSGVSDARLKKDILGLEGNGWADKIMKLRPVTYKWKDERMNKAHPREMGFIAQDVEAVFPLLVSTSRSPAHPDITDLRALEYDRLIVPLVKAFQELKTAFDTFVHNVTTHLLQHDSDIARLKEENRMLKDAVCKLSSKAAFCAAAR